MKAIKEGHTYQLANFENTSMSQTLQFIHKQPDLNSMNGRMTTVEDGTTNEEVLSVLIDRMKYLQDRFPCPENVIVITKLEESLMWLEKRTKDRQARGVEGKHIK